jgi:hypothetical protein
MSNTIKKQQSCHYSTYEKSKGSSDVEDCPKLATRTLIEIETSYPLCEEHYQLLTRQSGR